MRTFKLLEQNEFSKHFKSEDIDIYLAKAYDEDSKTDYVVANIPVIPETRTEHITYPMPFTNPEERDKIFDMFSESDCNDLIEDLIKFMQEQTVFLNEEQKKIDAQKNQNEIVDAEYEIKNPNQLN